MSLYIVLAKRICRISIYRDWFWKDLKNCLRNIDHFHRRFRKTGLNLWNREFSIYRTLAKNFIQAMHDSTAVMSNAVYIATPKPFGSLQGNKLMTVHRALHCEIVQIEILVIIPPQQKSQMFLLNTSAIVTRSVRRLHCRVTLILNVRTRFLVIE